MSKIIDINITEVKREVTLIDNGNRLIINVNNIYNSGGGGDGAVDSVNGQTGVVVLTTNEVADSNNKRYVTESEKTAIGTIGDKVDKVTGKSLILDSEITRLATVTNFDNSGNVTALGLKEDKVNKGVANGYASLDSSGKIPLSQIYDSVLGQVLYGGSANATTAVATLTNNAKQRLGTALATITLTNDTTAITGYEDNEGIYYIVSVAGTFSGISYEVGDWLISNGSAWQKVDNTDAVSSVAGLVGVISKSALQTALDLSGTNTGDETTSSIQTKRPLKTINSNSLEGSGNIDINSTTVLTYKNITSNDLNSQDVDGFLTYVNGVTSFAIASNEIVKYIITDTLQVFELKVNNRNVGSGETALISSNILVIEPDNYFNNIDFKDYIWESRGDATMTLLGSTIPNVTGTANVPALIGSGVYTSILSKTEITSLATAGSSASYRDGSFQPFNWSRGFYVNFVFAISDAVVVTDSRLFVGVLNSNSQIGNVDPSSLTNMFCVGKDSADTNLQIMHNDGTGTATKIDLGSNFPANTSATDVYSASFFTYPSSNILFYKIKRLGTSFEAKGKITTNLPTVNGAPHLNRNNGSTASAVRLTFVHQRTKIPM